MKLYEKEWPRDFNKRFFLGQHMPDADQNSELQGLLSNFNAQTFVAQLADAGCDMLYFYMSCHMGNCYYPSKVKYGRVHSGMNGRDFFGEVAEECVKREIALVAVYEFANMHYEMLPHLVPADWNHYKKNDKGETVSSGLCWNSGYGDFVIEQLEEVARDYPIAGFYIDMLDYPGRELCPNCVKRFKDELGKEPPTIQTDLHASVFKEYKMWTFRETAEYLNKIRNHVRNIIPEATVVSNHHCMIIEDLYDVTDAEDYLSTDPSIGYGHPGGRALARSTKIPPIFRTLSDGKDATFDILYDNILMGLEQVMPYEPFLSIAANAIAHGGWPCLCSMWRRNGSVNQTAMGLIKEVNAHVDKVKPWIGNRAALRHTGIYISQETRFLYDNPGDKINWFSPSGYDPCFIGAAMILDEEHILYDFLTKRQLTNLNDYKVILLPNAVSLSKNEVSAFKEYVRNGGTIISSYETSLANEWGNVKSNFQMADLFGIDSTGNRITPYQALQMKMKNPEKYPFKPWENPSVTLNEPALIISKRECAEEIASLHDRYRPSQKTGELPALRNSFVVEKSAAPAIVENKYGKGRSVYFAGKVFAAYAFNKIPEIRKVLARWLINDELRAAPVKIDAPGCVKLSAYERPEKGVWILHLVNNQTNPGDSYLLTKVPITEQLIPVHNIKMTLNIMKENKILNVKTIVSEEKLDFSEQNGVATLAIPMLNAHEVVVVEFAHKWNKRKRANPTANIARMINCDNSDSSLQIKEAKASLSDGWNGMGKGQ